jgi:hypothetical protein
VRHCDANRLIAYPAAKLGVVFSTKYRTQRFYCGHDDLILSMACHGSGTPVATGQFGALAKVLEYPF